MSGTYGEPVQVKARPDGRPIRFVWRSRLYTVRAILEHWVINREWWRDCRALACRLGRSVHECDDECIAHFWCELRI